MIKLYNINLKALTLRIVIAALLLTTVISVIVKWNTFDIQALGTTTEKSEVVDGLTVESGIVEKAKEELIVEPTKDPVIDEPVEIPFEEIAASLTIEERIKNVCEFYDVPFDIALAIARLETGWFTSNAYINKNNVGGLSKNEVPISFDSIDEGVEAFVRNLDKNYISIGLDTPEEIGKKYCPVDPNWGSKVRSLMEYGL